MDVSHGRLRECERERAVTVWTISAQAGSGGEQIARLLAERVGVPLVAPLTTDAPHGRRGIRRIGSWLFEAGACAGSMFVASADLRFVQPDTPSERELTESMISEAARSPAVIADWSAFAVLADHPAACHVRVRAPVEWRVALYARENCVPAGDAEQALRTLERERCAYVRQRHGRRLDAPENFTLVCDASRLAPRHMVDLLVAALGWSTR
jgi:cytidylate kinase